ncbi:hypothetical protein B0H34DRAFT_858027 [Crassisporium funariophilum]|nr:hypothetical protein B0H34DRAFT_858027 [Crassisporium funariophilum]
MTSALDSTFGVWLVSSFLQTILYGCGLLQTWLYFHWYSNDRWGIKAMVILLAIFETLQVTFFFASTYDNLITNFGNVTHLFVIDWVDTAQLIAGFISALIVQLYFVHCIYVLSEKQKLAPVLITILALIAFGAGLVQAIHGIQLGSFMRLDGIKAASVVQSVGTLTCDVVITMSLLRTLHSHKTETQSTNNILDTLMIHAINRGILTAIFAALALILFLTMPGTLWFVLAVELSSKLYMNSALATLNSRRRTKNATDNYVASNGESWHSIRFQDLSASRSQTTQEPVDASEDRVKVPPETPSYANESRGKHAFIDGMI